LALVPGLSHAVRKRFYGIRYCWFAWLAGFLLGIFFYGSIIGIFFMSLAVLFHALLVIHGSFLWGAFENIAARMVVVFVMMILLFFLYGWLGLFGLPDLRHRRTILNVPIQRFYQNKHRLDRFFQTDEDVRP
jgi:hypothetical protein